jgi:hypothetical protein
MVTDKDLKDMEFKCCGILESSAEEDHFEFKSKNPRGNTTAGVYLWLQRIKRDTYKVVYAGKAGNGISVRMGQHIGGLKIAPTERKERIKAAFGLDNRLEIWFRTSAKISLAQLSAEPISAYSTEEEALITRFAPELNRAKPPSMRTVSRQDAKLQSAKSAFTALSYELSTVNGEQRDLWDDALITLTESHREKIGKILLLLSDTSSLKDIWPNLDFKVVGLYRAGPIRNQSMLVFGKVSRKNFKKGSRVVYVSLERELIAFSTEVTRKMPKEPDDGEAYSLDFCLCMLAPKPT